MPAFDEGRDQPDRLDPVTGQVHAFARSLGIALAPVDAGNTSDDDPLSSAWHQLIAAGIEAPGFAFARWNSTGGMPGPLPPILANCPDVAALLERLQRFHPLFGRDEVVLHLGPTLASLSIRAIDGSPAHPDTVEASFALLCRVVEQLTQGQARPDRVRLRRRAPQDAAEHRALLGDVRFGSAHDRCEFDALTLRTSIVQADPTILSMLEPYAERLVDRRTEPWSRVVAALIGPNLADRPTLAPVAAALAMSPRLRSSRGRSSRRSPAIRDGPRCPPACGTP